MEKGYGDIISNESTKRTLAMMGKTGKFPNAVIIEGAEGSGRSTLAKIVAKTILCADLRYVSEHGAGCGECISCRKAEGGINPDLEVYGGEGSGANSFHVDKVRELSSTIYLTPTENEKRVIILKDIQTMTPQAQNALLKSIEEPPARVNFIITAASESGILETVKSRAAVFMTEHIGEKRIESYLREKYGDNERIESAVKFSNGTIGNAETFLEGGEGFETYGYIYGSVKACLKGGRESYIEKCELMRKNYKKGETVAYITAYEKALRDIYLYKSLITVKNEEYISEKLSFFDRTEETAVYTNMYSADRIRELIKICGQYKGNCGYNISVKLNFTAFLAEV